MSISKIPKIITGISSEFSKGAKKIASKVQEPITHTAQDATKVGQDAQTSYGKALLSKMSNDEYFDYFSKKWEKSLFVEENMDNLRELFKGEYADYVRQINSGRYNENIESILGLINKENIGNFMPLWNKRGSIGFEKTIKNLLEITNKNNIQYANIVADCINTDNAKSLTEVYKRAGCPYTGDFAKKLLENLNVDNAKYANVFEWMGGVGQNAEIQKKLISIFKKAGTQEGCNLRQNVLEPLDKIHQNLEKDIKSCKIDFFEGYIGGRLEALKYLLSRQNV